MGHSWSLFRTLRHTTPEQCRAVTARLDASAAPPCQLLAWATATAGSATTTRGERGSGGALTRPWAPGGFG